MTIGDFYQEHGNSGMYRIHDFSNKQMVRFNKMFLKDTTLALFRRSMMEHRMEDAQTYITGLYGASMEMGYTRLADYCGEMKQYVMWEGDPNIAIQLELIQFEYDAIKNDVKLLEECS